MQNEINSPELDPPFQPVRNKLYSSMELLNGFDPRDPESMARTLDFQSYLYFVRNGRATPRHPYAGMMQVMHDGSVARAMYEFIATHGRPAAAIMGGHKEIRGSETYAQVASLAATLTDRGFLVASGGGPGAMEATHLGALMAGRSGGELAEAVELLARTPKLPNTANVVDKDGNVSIELVKQLHEWAAPAIELQASIKSGGVSLAVPSWHYGHEPLSPLATHVAKYFLNSIREDVLLALATNGIVFAKGRAGTLQEVFQDAAQNYYASGDQPFAPMVFLDRKFWQQEMPVEPLLKALFENNGKKDEYALNVRFTDSVEEAATFLQERRPSSQMVATRMEKLGLGPMLQSLSVGWPTA